jgi:hypothetical protein
MQNSRKRQIKAAQRRAGGGGVLGVRPDSDSDDGLLNAAQIKVADALHKRIKKDFGNLEPLKIDSKHIKPPKSSSESSSDTESEKEDIKVAEVLEDSDGGGVALFKKGPLVTKVITTGADEKINGPRPRSKGATEESSDEEESKKRCRAAAIESDRLLENAEKAAENAKILIMPVNPTSDDEGGKAKKRRRKRLKEEEEERRKNGQVKATATDGEDDNEKTDKKKKKRIEASF